MRTRYMRSLRMMPAWMCLFASWYSIVGCGEDDLRQVSNNHPDASQDAVTDMQAADAPVDARTSDTHVTDTGLDAVEQPDAEQPDAEQPDVAAEGPPPDPVDDCQLRRALYARELHPGEGGRIYVTYTNTGNTTWTDAAGYRIESVLGNDPLFQPYPYAQMEAADTAAPGTDYRFTLYIIAPELTGTYDSPWQMNHMGVGRFGPQASGSVIVTPDPALCPAPAPPPVDKFNVVIHNDQGFKKVLDSTPLVYSPGGEYCTAIGFTDNRLFCPPRPEGHPEVEICNEQAVGRAEDTGRVGPTWTYNDLPCIDQSDVDGRCVNHSDNQFLVVVFGAGVARACGRNGVCGEVVVP